MLVQDLHETPGDLASMRQARQAGDAAIVTPQTHLEEAAQPRPSFLQVLHAPVKGYFVL